LTETGLIARTDTNVPPGIRELAFTVARPGGDRASYASGTLAGGDAAVVLVDEAVDGSFDSLDEQERTRVKAELLQAKANAYYRALVADLESRADIERRPVSDSAL
jgi:peptidyl-prolyl cis-trans isomerase D